MTEQETVWIKFRSHDICIKEKGWLHNRQEPRIVLKSCKPSFKCQDFPSVSAERSENIKLGTIEKIHKYPSREMQLGNLTVRIKVSIADPLVPRGRCLKARDLEQFLSGGTWERCVRGSNFEGKSCEKPLLESNLEWGIANFPCDKDWLVLLLKATLHSFKTPFHIIFIIYTVLKSAFYVYYNRHFPILSHIYAQDSSGAAAFRC